MHSSICGRIPLSGDLPTCFLNNPSLAVTDTSFVPVLPFFRVPGALHSDLCGGDVELPEIIRGELDGNRSDVLFKAFQFRGAGNRNDPGFLCKEPGERDLSGCRILLRGECSNQIHQSAICFAGFRREAGETATIVLLVKRRVFGNRPSEESLAKRTERNKAYAKFFERGNDFLFRAFPPERVFTLKRRYRLNCVCPADGLCPRFR